jgi:ribosomal protein S21
MGNAKIVRRGHEPIGFMLRKLKKSLERGGVIREMRDHAHYIKPSEKRRQKLNRKKKLVARKPEENGQRNERTHNGNGNGWD